jgi:hypothetical protein
MYGSFDSSHLCRTDGTRKVVMVKQEKMEVNVSSEEFSRRAGTNSAASRWPVRHLRVLVTRLEYRSTGVAVRISLHPFIDTVFLLWIILHCTGHHDAFRK